LFVAVQTAGKLTLGSAYSENRPSVVGAMNESFRIASRLAMLCALAISYLDISAMFDDTHRY